MANIPIWPGSSSFHPGDTPFGFYDNDPTFEKDADKVCTFVTRRLGYPLVEVELQAINIYAVANNSGTITEWTKNLVILWLGSIINNNQNGTTPQLAIK